MKKVTIATFALSLFFVSQASANDEFDLNYTFQSFNNTSEESTQIDRTEELEFVPYYQYRRPFSDPSTIRTNRKQVLRARLIDYYTNQGNAGTQALQSGLIRGDDLVVDRLNENPLVDAARAEIIKSVREQQKDQFSQNEQVSTEYQRSSRRVIASYGSRYSNPYQYPQDQ